MVDLQSLIFSPNDVGKFTTELVEYRATTKDRAVTSHIPSLDRELLAPFPGELVVIMGYASNYKSSFMSYWARVIAQDILDENTPETENDFVVFVSWEMSLEEFGFHDLARQAGLDGGDLWAGRVSEEDLRKTREAGAVRGALPLWMIGHSLIKRRQITTLTLEMVQDVLTRIEDTKGYAPRAVFL